MWCAVVTIFIFSAPKLININRSTCIYRVNVECITELEYTNSIYTIPENNLPQNNHLIDTCSLKFLDPFLWRNRSWWREEANRIIFATSLGKVQAESR